MRKQSIRTRYRSYLIGDIVTIVFSAGIEIMFIVKKQDLIDKIGLAWCIVVIIALFIVFAFVCVNSIKDIRMLLKDREALSKKEFVIVVGKVIGFKEHKSPDTGIQSNDTPVILTIDTNEEIELHVYEENTKIGEIYKFQFLKNSKIGEVVEHIETKDNF